MSQRVFLRADERHGADGEVVWSWHPGADAKFAMQRASRATGAKQPVPEETRINCKTIARGMPDAG